jgi:hypothetical protein
MRFPIYFNDSISLKEIADALASKGIHLYSDPASRMVADSVPRFLAPDSNVVPLKKGKRA